MEIDNFFIIWYKRWWMVYFKLKVVNIIIVLYIIEFEEGWFSFKRNLIFVLDNEEKFCVYMRLGEIFFFLGSFIFLNVCDRR